MSLTMNRRRFLTLMAAAGLAVHAPWGMAAAEGRRSDPILKAIPATGEPLPVIGMGTWRTFNVGGDPKLIEERTEILRLFFEAGGTVVDSSPMYGSAEQLMGEALEELGDERVFSASKIWTRGQQAGVEGAEQSRRLWGIERFDLLQIHNLLDWQAHLQTLKRMKAEGEVRYLGITTSHGRRHGDFERIMTDEPLDFVQLTYNITDREAEQRLLPLAQEKGIAVIANRPFRGGSLFSQVSRRQLPGWASEIDCSNWAQFFLKYIVSHPAITCAIPATSQREHMRENMGALYGALPDASMRERMARYFREL